MSHQAVGARPGRRMVSLGKVTVPKPMNLPSQRRENNGFDPNVTIVSKTASGWGDPNAHDPSVQPIGSAAWGAGARTETPSSGAGAWAASAPPLPPRRTNHSAKEEFPTLAAGNTEEQSASDQQTGQDRPGWDADERSTALPGHLTGQAPQQHPERDVAVLGYHRGQPPSPPSQLNPSAGVPGHNEQRWSGQAGSHPDRGPPQAAPLQSVQPPVGSGAFGQRPDVHPDRTTQGSLVDAAASQPGREQSCDMQPQPGFPGSGQGSGPAPPRGPYPNRDARGGAPPHQPLQQHNRLPPREDTGSYSRGPPGPPRERHLFGERGPSVNAGPRRPDYGRGQRHVNDDRDWMARPNGVPSSRHPGRSAGGQGRHRNEDVRLPESPHSSASGSTIRTTKATVGTASYVAASDLGSIADEDSAPLDRLVVDGPPLAEGERRLSEVSRRSEPQRVRDSDLPPQAQQQSEAAAPVDRRSHQPLQGPQHQSQQQLQQIQQQNAGQAVPAPQKAGRPRGGERERERKARKAAAAERAEGGNAAEASQPSGAPSHDQFPVSNAPKPQQPPLPQQPQQQQATGHDQAPGGRPMPAAQPPQGQATQLMQPSHMLQQSNQPQQQHQLFQQPALPHLQHQYAQQRAHQAPSGGAHPPQLALNVGSAPSGSPPFAPHSVGNCVAPPQQLQFMQNGPYSSLPSQNGPLMNGATRPQQHPPPPGHNLPGLPPHQSQLPQQQQQLLPLGLHMQQLNMQEPRQLHSQGFASGQRAVMGRDFAQSAHHQQQQQQQQPLQPQPPQQQQSSGIPERLPLQAPGSLAVPADHPGAPQPIDSRMTQQPSQFSSAPSGGRAPGIRQPLQSGPELALALQPPPQQAEQTHEQGVRERAGSTATGLSSEEQAQFMRRKAAERGAEKRRHDVGNRDGHSSQAPVGAANPTGPPPGALGLPPTRGASVSGAAGGSGRGRGDKGVDRGDRNRGRGRGREGRGGRGGGGGGNGNREPGRTLAVPQAASANAVQAGGGTLQVAEGGNDGIRPQRQQRRDKGNRSGGENRPPARSQESEAAPDTSRRGRNCGRGRSSDTRNADGPPAVVDHVRSGGEERPAPRRPRGGHGSNGARDNRGAPSGSAHGGSAVTASNPAGTSPVAGSTAVSVGEGAAPTASASADNSRSERRNRSYRSSRGGRGKGKNQGDSGAAQSGSDAAATKAGAGPPPPPPAAAAVPATAAV